MYFYAIVQILTDCTPLDYDLSQFFYIILKEAHSQYES